MTTGDAESWNPHLWVELAAMLKNKSNPSMLDVGCGVGFAQRFFNEGGFATTGLDCEQMRTYHLLPLKFVAHDLTTGPWVAERPFDLVWCCEVVEHIFETHVQNVVDTLAKNCGELLALTAAPVGADGCHHVNCQNAPYWIEKFEKAGLVFLRDETERLKKIAGIYFRRNGMVFKRP